MVSHAELAEHVGASTASTWRRVKALEESGILKRAVRLVDASKVGRGVNIFCNIRLLSSDNPLDARKSFEKFVGTCPEIVECFAMSGEWDYLLRIVAADVADYHNFFMIVLLSHPSVASVSSHFALTMTKYTTALPV